MNKVKNRPIEMQNGSLGVLFISTENRKQIISLSSKPV